MLKRLKNWCPQPRIPAESHLRKQNVNLLSAGSVYEKITLTLRLSYGTLLISLLFTPFAFYFSRTEPYFMGHIWGYQLPIGYAGLVLGLLVILSPKTIGKKVKFGTFIAVVGLTLIIIVFLSPYEYFINLIQGTNLSGGAIDVEYPIGHIFTIYLALFGIIVGIAARIGSLLKKSNIVRPHP